MIKILESDDPVRLGFLRQVLEQADLHPFVFTMSGYPGVQPSRLMVPEAEEDLARQLIAEIEGDL
ncbi:MAG: putative signal transducing protein [Caulobacteraceae bacterium]